MGPVATVGGPEGARYAVREQQFVSARTQKVGVHIRQTPNSSSHAALYAAVMDRSAINGPRPGTAGSVVSPCFEHPEMAHAFTRPMSSGSAGSYATASSFVTSRVSGSSISSQTSFESMPPFGPRTSSMPTYARYQLQNGPHAFPWQQPAPPKPYRRRARPGELFDALPGEVLELILENLRAQHLQPGSISCATCWMRDCCAVALSARKCLKYARVALYEDIQLVGPDSPHMKKRTKLAYGARLVLLRRTLRANESAAAVVKSLKVPSLPAGIAASEYHKLVASVVMACPNLERLVGFYPTYDHSFSPLFHALSTRSRLKEMNWILEASPSQRQQQQQQQQRHIHGAGTNENPVPDDLQPAESASFVEMHVNWECLAILVVHCRPGATLSPDTLLETTLRNLPSLQSLYLSHLPCTAFNDSSLLSLPPLKRLTLAHLEGVTAAGLSSFATRATSALLTTLTLMHVNVTSLPALARVLSNLPYLETFNLVQGVVPAMPPGEQIWMFPYLASASVWALHWDVPNIALAPRASAADGILAKSIAAGGFPCLRRLRTPHDPEGIFQGLCRPRERIDTPSDKYHGGSVSGGGGLVQFATNGPAVSLPGATPSTASSPTTASGLGAPYNGNGNGNGNGSIGHHSHSDSLVSSTLSTMSPSVHSPTTSGFSFFFSSSSASGAESIGTGDLLPSTEVRRASLGFCNSDLRAARLAAQARLEAARQFPRYLINVLDEESALVDKFAVGAFAGTVESLITYVLTPDKDGGRDEGGGLVGVAEMLGDCKEELVVRVPPPGVSASASGMGTGWERSPEGGVAEGKGGRKKKDKRKKEEVDVGRGAGWTTRTREGCTGRWNAYTGRPADKKGKERWAHTERGRWRGVVLS